MPFSSSDPLGYTGINQAQQPPFINADRAPTDSDFYQAGSQWQDNSVEPPVIYETTGDGEWDVGGNAYATDSAPGIVQLSEDVDADYPSDSLVPTVTAVKDYVDSVAVVAATAVDDTDSPYTVLETDYLIAVDTTAGAVTVTLPAATGLGGKTFVIRDVGGSASTNNITIGGGGTNLAGGGASAATKTISTDYAGATVISDGTIWTYAYVA